MLREKSGLFNFIWAACLIFITLIIIVPLIFVFTSLNAGDFSFLKDSVVVKTAIKNTFFECLCSTTVSVIIGYIYAYGVIRGDIPFAKFFSTLPFIHLMTPPFVGGLSFILLLGRNGFITHKLFGLDISLYGFWGLLIAQSLCFFPIAYMILSQVLNGINPAYEQAAFSLGSNRFKTFISVTLPLSFPGIISAFLFIAVSVMSDFGNPMIVAGRYRVLAVEIYTQLTGWVNPSRSALLGIILVLPSLALFILQNVLTKKNMLKTATIGGKVQKVQHRKASLGVRVFLTIFCSFIALCVIAQFAAIVAGSFQKLWGINTKFTWEHVKNIGRATKEIKNSIIFSLEASLLSTLLAVLLSYFVYRTKAPLKKYMEITAQISAAIPGSLSGLAFSLMAAKLNFHNSGLLIVLAITVGFLPFSYRIISSSYAQIKTSIDDGARALGASRLRVLESILIPLCENGIFYAFLYDFVRGVGTMSAVIFLVSFKTPLAAVKILNLSEQGFWGDAAALALLLTLITFTFIALGEFLLKIRKKKNLHFEIKDSVL